MIATGPAYCRVDSTEVTEKRLKRKRRESLATASSSTQTATATTATAAPVEASTSASISAANLSLKRLQLDADATKKPRRHSRSAAIKAKAAQAAAELELVVDLPVATVTVQQAQEQEDEIPLSFPSLNLNLSLTEEVKPTVSLDNKKTVTFAVALTEDITSATGTGSYTLDASLKSSIWYSKADYVSFKAAIRRDVTHMAMLCHRDSLRKLDFNEHSVVGIEKYCCSSQEQIKARSIQKQLVQAVLDQQTLQKTLNLKDEETMRMISLVYTHQGIQQALLRAKAFLQQ
ncbi:expressed unknown protein [Seminavis robusta]|uniref:Uncharacterized protein n=1 Tax=Seminavis robusta TaxID=568900 RepID=A0A9N8DCJ9_9STRA|nr:expressed unknown protein [Seminavis robusta]|eukprot:Sro60_g034840.1 n/a (289) ;mRNA; r:121149-122015